MREPLPHWVTEAMLWLEQNGEEAWLVGGCVRDRLLGRPVHDYDLTVSCLPDRTAWLFRDRSSLPVSLTISRSNGPVSYGCSPRPFSPPPMATIFPIQSPPFMIVLPLL